MTTSITTKGDHQLCTVTEEQQYANSDGLVVVVVKI